MNILLVEDKHMKENLMFIEYCLGFLCELS
jgi:hypothetical protein